MCAYYKDLLSERLPFSADNPRARPAVGTAFGIERAVGADIRGTERMSVTEEQGRPF